MVLVLTSNYHYYYFFRGKLNLITVNFMRNLTSIPWNFHLAKPNIPDLGVRCPQSFLAASLTGCNAALS